MGTHLNLASDMRQLALITLLPLALAVATVVATPVERTNGVISKNFQHDYELESYNHFIPVNRDSLLLHPHTYHLINADERRGLAKRAPKPPKFPFKFPGPKGKKKKKPFFKPFGKKAKKPLKKAKKPAKPFGKKGGKKAGKKGKPFAKPFGKKAKKGGKPALALSGPGLPAIPAIGLGGPGLGLGGAALAFGLGGGGGGGGGGGQGRR